MTYAHTSKWLRCYNTDCTVVLSNCLCPRSLQALSFPFPAQLLWEQKGQQWQRSHLNTCTGYGCGMLRRTPGTDKKQQCRAAAGAATVSFVFWPWDSCLQPPGHGRVGSSQISLSSGHVAPGELHFYYWFVLCGNGHHYKVLRSPAKLPWSCRLQREHKDHASSDKIGVQVILQQKWNCPAAFISPTLEF